MADEENFNHCLISPCFARVSRNYKMYCFHLSKIWQDGASCDYLLVAKIVVKHKDLLLSILIVHITFGFRVENR